MRSRKRWRIGVAVLATLIVGGAVSVALAVTNVTSGGAIGAVKVKRSTDAITTTSITDVDVPGASTTIRVPSGHKGLILARFSAESLCDGGTAGNWCSLRILVGGVEAQPAAGLNFAFDTDVASDDIWEGHSMDRSRVVGAGLKTVKVQWAVTDAATTFRLDDWSLTVERSNK
jgi:hypothetical protein